MSAKSYYVSAVLESTRFETDDMPFYTWYLWGVDEKGRETLVGDYSERHKEARAARLALEAFGFTVASRELKASL